MPLDELPESERTCGNCVAKPLIEECGLYSCALHPRTSGEGYSCWGEWIVNRCARAEKKIAQLERKRDEGLTRIADLEYERDDHVRRWVEVEREVARLRAALLDIASSGAQAGGSKQYDNSECLRRYETDGGCDQCCTPGRESGMTCPCGEALRVLRGGA